MGPPQESTPASSTQASEMLPSTGLRTTFLASTEARLGGCGTLESATSPDHDLLPGLRGFSVKQSGWLALIATISVGALSAQGSGLPHPFELDRINRKLAGKIVDHTSRHGSDRRIWSEALGEKRDLYVYLPPGYDPCRQYPLILWLHGYTQDEHSLLDYVVKPLDDAMSCGKLAPAVVVVPDGSYYGRSSLFRPGTFFLNTRAGRFEDFVMQDVWDFIHRHYSLRPEREANVIAGVSMGGGSAFNMAFKYRERFKIVVGFLPPLNTRWVDARGHYMSNFDPNNWGWRTDVSRGLEVVGRFYGVITVRMGRVMGALYDRDDPMTIHEISRENPIEMLDRLCVKEGELDMFVAYGGKDQFNLDAQVESFLHVARQRGLTVGVAYEPDGKHDFATAHKMIPQLLEWLAPRLLP